MANSWMVLSGSDATLDSSLRLVATDSQITNLTVTGTFNGGSPDASLVPNADNVYNLGSMASRWANLYLGTDAVVSGNVSCDRLSATNATNQLALGPSSTINVPTPASARVYQIPDLGGSTDFCMIGGTQTFSGTKFFSARPRLVSAGNQLEFQQAGAGNTMNIVMASPGTSRVYTLPDAMDNASFVLSTGGTNTQSAPGASVTINGKSGVITSASLTTAAGSSETFNLINSAISASSVILVCVCNYPGTGIPLISVNSVAGGQCGIVIRNIDALAAFNDIIKVSFLVC